MHLLSLHTLTPIPSPPPFVQKALAAGMKVFQELSMGDVEARAPYEAKFLEAAAANFGQLRARLLEEADKAISNLLADATSKISAVGAPNAAVLYVLVAPRCALQGRTEPCCAALCCAVLCCALMRLVVLCCAELC